ncbi:hypothetical protein [Streptomyces globisporus]
MNAHTPSDDPFDIGGPHQEERSGVELFPVNFTTYRDPRLRDLETEKHVTEIAELLAPFSSQKCRWAVPPPERDRQAVEDRLGAWKQPAAGRHGNSILYWIGHGSAHHLAHHRTPFPIDNGVLPADLADAIGARLRHPCNERSWTVVILDSCFSSEFARQVELDLMLRHGGAQRLLLLSTAAHEFAELGAFARVLKETLTVTFRGRSSIGLTELGEALVRGLHGHKGGAVDNLRDQLVRRDPDIAASVSAPLDQLDELQHVIDQLSPDEKRHFLPKASGAELGELAWYFHGRTLQRDRILRWLTDACQGALVVTGPAGAGKSALLGHILLRTRRELREILTSRGHLTPLPAGTPCPDDPFDLTAHLAGLTLNQTIGLIADAANLPDIARDADQGQPAATLASRLLTSLREGRLPRTLLFDALDEADQPLTIAETLLRPIAALPNVRVIIGTRRSTREGPDHPAPADTDLLDALWPRARSAAAGPATDPVVVEVNQDPEALAGYLGTKLQAAKGQGRLDADDADIVDAVHRLVADHPKGDGQPQQFLYARLAAHELINDPALITDPAPLIGRTHRDLFTRALERLHRINPHYGALLNALGLAQGRGLPDQDGIWALVAGALSPTTEPVRMRSTIQQLLKDAAPYLALDQEHGQSVYRLAHRTFTEHFITAPGTAQGHSAITTALVQHASSILRRSSAHSTTGASAAPAAVSPYIRHHLAAHARLGHTAGALDTLGDQPQVVDVLDLAGITTAIFGHGLPAQTLPPALAGTALLQHHVRDTVPDQADPTDAAAWRRWLRRLGTTFIEGTPPRAEPRDQETRTRLPELITGQVQRRQLHLQLTGHTGRVRAMAAFKALDGSPRLATGSQDGTVRIWDPATGAQDGEPLTGHKDAVSAVVAFTKPDGSPQLVTKSNDWTVRVWDPATGEQVGKPLTGNAEFVTAVAAFTNRDGVPRVATIGYSLILRIWDPATGDQVGEIPTGHSGWVPAMAAFTAQDGSSRLATSSSVDHEVRIWDPATGDQDCDPLTGHNGGVCSVTAFTAPDGTSLLATGSFDQTVRMWDPATGDQDGEPLCYFSRAVTEAAVFTTPDGTRRLATHSNDSTVRIGDPATGAQDGEPLSGHTDTVNAMAVLMASDGTPRLATGSDDWTVRIWDPATGAQDSKPISPYIGGVTNLALFTAPDGTPRLATSSVSDSYETTVRIWDPATSEEVTESLQVYTDRVTAEAVFTALDGPSLRVIVSDNGKVRIGDWGSRYLAGEPLSGHTMTAMAVFTALDGTARLAAGSDDGAVWIWDPATGSQDGEPFTLDPEWTRAGAAFMAGVTAVAAFTALDGTARLAIGGLSDIYKPTVWIWNPATGSQDGEPLTSHPDWARAGAAFMAPDGTPRLATGSQDGTVRIWNPTTKQETLLPLAANIHALAATGGLLIAGTDAGFLCFDLSTMFTNGTRD